MIDTYELEKTIVNTIRTIVGSDLSVVTTPPQWTITGLGEVAIADQVFTGIDLPACMIARDLYFTSNPVLLVLGVVCTLKVPNKHPVTQTYGTTKPSVVRNTVYDSTGTTAVPTQPEYPYVSVNFTRTMDDGVPLTQTFFRGDDKVYQTHKLCVFSIKVFGTKKDNPPLISSKIHMMLEVEGPRVMINTLAPVEASVLRKTNQTTTASVMQDKHVVITSFDLTLAVLDEVVISAGWGSEIISEVVLPLSSGIVLSS